MSGWWIHNPDTHEPIRQASIKELATFIEYGEGYLLWHNPNQVIDLR